MKVALVHDFLVKLGGAERVLKSLTDLFPSAPIFTLLYDEKKVGKVFPKQKIITSHLQKLPKFLFDKRRYLLPFLPKAVERFNLNQYDLIISSSSAFAHGIITPSRSRHICYCHSPMRYAWDWYHEYKKEQNVGIFRSIFLSLLMKKIRMWDKIASDRPDFYLANSQTVQQRIHKYYRLPSTIIYPPVKVERFNVRKDHADYFLIISTLSPYKKIDLAIKLFNKIKRRLIIIGEGLAEGYLKSIAAPNIEFLGFKKDDVVKEYLENCRALIFPGEDDFGITPVEAMACGKPVLAYGRGGATETIIPGKTGELFSELEIGSMENSLGRLLLNEKKYDPDFIRKRAEEFSEENFKNKIQEFIKTNI